MNRLTRTAIDDSLLQQIQFANESLQNLLEYINRRNAEETEEIDRIIKEYENLERKVNAVHAHGIRRHATATDAALQDIVNMCDTLQQSLSKLENAAMALPKATPTQRDTRYELIKKIGVVLNALDDVANTALSLMG